MKTVELIPIGTVKSTRSAIVDDDWDRETSSIELDSRFSAEALQGLNEFSHVLVVFHMDRLDPAKIETSARYPRNNKEWPRVGVFAQRTKNRPNGIGVTVCRILRVDGSQLHVQGLDAIDGTPVLDIKPWVVEFGPRGEVRQPQWISELMKSYWV